MKKLFKRTLNILILFFSIVTIAPMYLLIFDHLTTECNQSKLENIILKTGIILP